MSIELNLHIKLGNIVLLSLYLRLHLFMLHCSLTFLLSKYLTFQVKLLSKDLTFFHYLKGNIFSLYFQTVYHYYVDNNLLFGISHFLKLETCGSYIQ